MIVVLIIILIVVLFMVANWKTDWKAIDKQNQQFYVDGYHLYYDRKILRQNEVKQ